MILIRSKSASRFQALCFSTIRKHQIHSSLCAEASSLTRMRSRRSQLVASSSDIIFSAITLLDRYFFQNQIKNGVFGTRVHVTSSPRCLGLPLGCLQMFRFPGDNALAMLLRSVSPYTLALLRSALGRRRLGRWRLRPWFNPADVLLSWSSDWGRGVI